MMKKAHHPTLVEVAKRAGVGIATVSRAINGGYRVDPVTLARVQQAVDALGYIPSQAARVLKGDRTRMVGFVVPSIADPFFSACAEAAQTVARSHDSMLMLLTTQDDPKIEMDAVRMLLRHRVDGFIITPAVFDSPTLVSFLHKVQVPVVTLDRPFDKSDVPCVVVDNLVGAQIATEHLIEHGYRRIICLTGDPGPYTIQERVRGYKKAMQSAGLEPTVQVSAFDSYQAERVISRLFAGANCPDAIFTVKNSVTIATFESLQKLKISIPNTVALMGYDDFRLADTLRPSISVVCQPVERLGETAAKMLFERLSVSDDSRSDKQPVVQVQLETHLILRESCGCTDFAPTSQ